MADKPYDRLDGVIWYDGKLVPWGEATLHVCSHGLHYASSVFEGERAYGGEIFKMHRALRTAASAPRRCSTSKSPIRSPRSTRPSGWSWRRTASRTPMCGRSPGAAPR